MRIRRPAAVAAGLFLLIALHTARAGASDAALLDDNDRAAFQRWFTTLADAQFERRAADVIDCAALVRHAYREALRAHTPEWRRAYQLPIAAAIPDVRRPPTVRDGVWPLFRVARHPDRFAEFADADAIVKFNTRPLGRDVARLVPGDLLYFRQDAATSPSHLMVFVGPSAFDRDAQDWVVYHTGPDGADPGEVRKVRLADLMRHPSPRWRPVPGNAAFVGAFRWLQLARER